MTPKIAFTLGASCAGCDYSLLDLGSKVLDVLEKVQVVYWPTAMDAKIEDVEKLGNKEIDVTLFDGALRNTEDEKLAKLFREKSKILVAYGSCSCFGGIPGLAATIETSSLMDSILRGTVPPASDTSPIPNGDGLSIPKLLPTVKRLDQLVEVDYYLPGCPPPLQLIVNAFQAFLSETKPPKGSVLAPAKALCDECPRLRENKRLEKIKRYHTVIPDQEKCLLEQGIVCMGPATRAGCQAACPKVNIACTGCMGPGPAVFDQGSKMLSAIASGIGVASEKSLETKEFEKLVEEIRDPLGTFYRYTLAGSVLQKAVEHAS